MTTLNMINARVVVVILLSTTLVLVVQLILNARNVLSASSFNFGFLAAAVQDQHVVITELDAALNRAAYNSKVILIWHADEDLSKTSKNRSLEWRCGSCLITRNKEAIDESNTAAIVFHYRYATPKLLPPLSTRRKDQLYVWLTGESPSNLFNYRYMNFVYEDFYKFNATMSYRRDSDIYFPYGKHFLPLEDDLEKILQSKTHVAAALVSDCGPLPAAKARREYLQLLRSNFPLDAFGKCFQNPIVNKNKTELRKILKQYKFYFAMENSWKCRDYITEKFFFNALSANSLPVVWGPPRRDYEALFPPESFIHIDDYDSVEKLIARLNYLNSNDTAYLEHFRWRKEIENTAKDEEHRAYGYCQLCRIIHGINVDDVYKSNYDPMSPVRPLFTEGTSHRTMLSLKKWLLNDNEECFKKKLTVTSAGKILPAS